MGPKYASSYERDIDEIMEAQMDHISNDDPVFNGYQQLSEPNPTSPLQIKLPKPFPKAKVPTKGNLTYAVFNKLNNGIVRNYR